MRKIAELAVQNYITNDKVNVAGLVLAGSADFKLISYHPGAGGNGAVRTFCAPFGSGSDDL